MKCLNCGAENDERNVFCSNCGADLTVRDKQKLFQSKKFIALISLGIIMGVIALAVLIGTVVIPNQAVAKMRNAFESKSSSEVINVFEDYCGTDSVVYDELSPAGKKAYDEFILQVNMAREDLNAKSFDEDKLNEAEPNVLILDYSFEKYGDIFLTQKNEPLMIIADYNDELNATVMAFYDLVVSRYSYLCGVKCIKTGGSLSIAVDYFMKVIEEDRMYENAQRKLTETQENLLQETLANIDKYINQGNFDKAFAEIEQVRNGVITDEIKAKLDDYEVNIYEAQLTRIDEFINKGDIEGAKEYIDSLGDNLSVESIKRLNQALKNKANEYIAKADSALKTGEREGAYNMAKAALDLCPDDEDIKSKVEYFKQYLPYELYLEKNVLKKNDDFQEFPHSCSIYYNFGNRSNDNRGMKNCIEVCYTISSGKMLELTYNAGRQFDVLSGTEFIPSSAKNVKQVGYFEIYGDGKKIYTSRKLKSGVLPKDFSVNISGIDVIEVKFYGDTDVRFYGTNDLPRYDISNLVATKNLPK